MIIGEAKSAIELVTTAWSWLVDRRDPVRLQCIRLIGAFEAHGIARQQIARVLPKELALPVATFSTPTVLKEHLIPQMLDWAADYLNLNRRWLDGLDEHPHVDVNGYKNEVVYMKWMQERIATNPAVHRRVHVLASQDLTRAEVKAI